MFGIHILSYSVEIHKYYQNLIVKPNFFFWFTYHKIPTRKLITKFNKKIDTTTAAAARLSFPILVQQQQPTSFVNYRHHLFSTSSVFALRLPKVSRITARVFSSFQVAMGDAPDPGTDAVQRRLMFEDE